MKNTNEQIIQNYVSFMEEIAGNSKHGYDQIYRWSEKGDYDCSSLVITALEQAGIKAKTNGATYTGNMKSVLLKLNFEDVTKNIDLTTGAGLQRGDILLNERYHVAVYSGENQMVQASINEKGTIMGGLPGDQTGQEINISKYKNYSKGWDCILRLKQPVIQNVNQEITPKEKENNIIVEEKDYMINGQKIKLSTIQKDNYNYVKLRDLETAGILKADYKKDEKLPIIQTI